MMNRPDLRAAVGRALARAPICALLGPRQCGKTTLAREVLREMPGTLYDLESPRDQARLLNPEMILASHRGLVVLDEIQARPDLFPVLRVLADRAGRRKARFLILGSASPQMSRGASESLAGRVEFVDMSGFCLRETGAGAWRQLWVRGGFPPSFLARSENGSFAWRESFIRTFLERDLPQAGISIPAPAMRRFWTMVACAHGQTWNSSEIARSMGLSDKTVRGYLDTLTETFMLRQLQPWHENLGKRQVKSPKIYLRDSGLLHSLLGLSDFREVTGHPRTGASWEGFALEQVLRLHPRGSAWFWATQSGAELDLFVQEKGRRWGYEFKFSEKPVPTRSMHIAMEDLKLDRLTVVCPGNLQVRWEARMEVRGIETLASKEH